MRGLISEARPGGPGVAAPMALRRAVPAVYQEDPLFSELCQAFDELIAPLVSAMDCFTAYLDPRLAPDDFLPWLADLVGCAEPPMDAVAARERIAGAVQGHGLRGTPAGIRAAAARAAAVPEAYVELDDPGGTRWSNTSLAVHDWPDGRARVRVLIGPHQDPDDVAAAVRAALQAEAAVHCRIDVEVEVSQTPAPAPPAFDQPHGPRMYGDQP